eukprot:CAMPEP_0180036826 /NCGR_PEP_ID=MMETSP0984-20121128/31152_1 /TAXON_ID=483367 /ORGANISM="non described non described, Strain CCMP 2436" /LENGTH=223 /DNA_ID=CAMNT_0021963063 /DNA_START=14 /DNA_END=686 /DNA_ORIENTATION=+
MSRPILLAAAVMLTGQGAHGAGAVVLTRDNYDELTSGKNMFIKFFAPWCGHCKAMAPAWGELGTEFEGSSSVVIGDVDCTSDGGKPLCDAQEVRGYPTVMYFNGETGEKGEKYNGGRDTETLKKFTLESLSAKCKVVLHDGGRDTETLKKFTLESLSAKCKVEETSACSEKEIGYIEKMKGDSAESAKQLERLKGMKGNSMAPELKKWLNQRIAILEQVAVPL